MRRNEEITKRLYAIAIKYCALFCAALAYLMLVLFTDFGIPCVFYEITGFKCPGCGISRMFAALARLDFIAAFKENPLVFLTGPFVLVYIVCAEIKYVRYGNRKMGKWETVVWAELCLALAYGVLRNILYI